MSELLAPGSAATTEALIDADPGDTIGSASYLSHFTAIGRLGYPAAIASNPILEADDSSPWWQSRMVCKASAGPDDPSGPSQPEPDGRLGSVVSHLLGKRAPAGEPIPVTGFDPIVYVDLGSGAVTALPIGNLMPVQRDWSWTDAPDEVVSAQTAFLPAETATIEVASLPAAEPEWNEADDELPSWIKLDSAAYGSGALMGRRRASNSGE